MQEPRYKVRFKQIGTSVQVEYFIEMPETDSEPVRVEIKHNDNIVTISQQVFHRYGEFILGTQIVVTASILTGTQLIPEANLTDDLGVRVIGSNGAYRWSTNDRKPPFLAANPNRVASRFDEDVQIYHSHLAPAIRNSVLTWRVISNG